MAEHELRTNVCVTHNRSILACLADAEKRADHEHELRMRFIADTVDGMECLPKCDSYGHEEMCPVANPVEAFELLRQQLSLAEKRAEEAERHAVYNKQKQQAEYSERCDQVATLTSQLSFAKEEVERLTGTTRVIDGKFAVRGGVIVKMSSGEVVPEDEPLVLMRGRDHLIVATLMHYRNLCRLDGCNDYQLGLVDELIEKFTRYASDPSRMKQPGVTRGAAWNPAAAPSPEGKGSDPSCPQCGCSAHWTRCQTDGCTTSPNAKERPLPSPEGKEK